MTDQPDQPAEPAEPAADQPAYNRDATAKRDRSLLIKDGNQNWTDYLRMLLSFGLGMGLIIYAIIQKGLNATLLIVGLLLMGIVPIDAILARFGWGSKNSNGS